MAAGGSDSAAAQVAARLRGLVDIAAAASDLQSLRCGVTMEDAVLLPKAYSAEMEPMCNGCGHRHFAHEKCKVCGHVGTSALYQWCKRKRPMGRQFYVEYFDRSIDKQVHRNYEEMLAILRRHGFSYETFERDVPEGAMWVPEEKLICAYDRMPGCRHVIGYIGDSAVGSATVVPTKDSSGNVIARLEKWSVMPAYRRRGFGKRILLSALADAYGRSGEGGGVGLLSRCRWVWFHLFSLLTSLVLSPHGI